MPTESRRCCYKTKAPKVPGGQSAKGPECQGAKVPRGQSAKGPKCQGAKVPRGQHGDTLAPWPPGTLAPGTLAPWHLGPLAPFLMRR
jgi:hypothetical protein